MDNVGSVSPSAGSSSSAPDHSEPGGLVAQTGAVGSGPSTAAAPEDVAGQETDSSGTGQQQPGAVQQNLGPTEPGATPAPPEAQAPLAGPLLVYSLLRLALVAVLTAILMIFMPLIVALMFAIVVQLPLAWVLFSGPRRKVNDAMAQRSAARRAARDSLQSALSGVESGQ